MTNEFSNFPAELLSKASLAGHEYAWPIADIPAVIEAARVANLVNVGGQLQFRVPQGVCECYWVEVDTYREVPNTIPWPEQVERTAASAREQFEQLKQTFDFAQEGLKAFPTYLSEATESGRPANSMCFVWYVLANDQTRSGKLRNAASPAARG